MKGLVTGVLALTGLYLVTTSGAGRLSGALAVPTGWLAAWADPSVPLIRNRAGQAPSASASQAAPHPRSGPAAPTGGHAYNPIGAAT